MEDKLVCKICNISCNNFKSLASHTRQKHFINKKYYYDKYFKKENEGICKFDGCDNETSFLSISKGYSLFCSQKCVNNYPERLELASKLGKEISNRPEVKKRMSESAIKQWKENKDFINKVTTSGSEYRIKQGKTQIKRYEDINERIKTGESIKKAYNENPNFKEKHSNSLKQIYINDPNKKIEMSKRIKKIYKDRPELRIKQSESHKRVWADPNSIFNSIEFLSRWKKSLDIKPNKPELFLINLFKELNLSYEYTGDYSIFIERKNPDFIDKNNKRIIEFFGDYWHGEDYRKTLYDFKSNEEHEKYIINHYNRNGYKCLVIWENELKILDNVINKILDFSGDNKNV